MNLVLAAAALILLSAVCAQIWLAVRPPRWADTPEDAYQFNAAEGPSLDAVPADAGIEFTQANGYALGRPPGRDPHDLDAVVQTVIESVPASTRLYPDVFAWMVTDAILKEIGLSVAEAEGGPTDV